MKNNTGPDAWVMKADADCDAVLSAVQRRKRGVADVACFHAQQCIEKYLKGFLVAHDKPFPKTHDLGELVKLAVEIDPLLAGIEADADFLTDYAVDFHHPDDGATPAEGRQAVERMRRLRAFLRKKLGVTPGARKRRR